MRVRGASRFDLLCEDHRKAAEPTFEEEIPHQLADLMQGVGRRVSVEHYEVLLEQRPSV
jgi:hypothetical protein